MENLIVCSQCSLPTPSHGTKCIHCSHSLKNEKRSLAIKTLWKYYSIGSFILLGISYLFLGFKDFHILSILIKLNAFYIILIDMLIDPYWKNQKIISWPIYRIKQLTVYMISVYFLDLVRKKVKLI